MIKINEKTFEFKYSLRACFIWEEITGKHFEINTLLDTYIFAYSCIVANSENPQIEFSDFIDACDKDSSIIESFQQFMDDELKKRELTGKKKVTKKERN